MLWGTVSHPYRLPDGPGSWPFSGKVVVRSIATNAVSLVSKLSRAISSPWGQSADGHWVSRSTGLALHR
jgi:hypothetical protein